MTSDHDTAGGMARLPDDEISLWEVLAVLVRRRGWIVGMVLLTAGLAATYGLVRQESFTTEASFSPQGSEVAASDLSALASQFGVNVGGLNEGVSPAFYSELLSSREILYRVVTTPYQVDGIGGTTLPDVLEIEQDTEDLRVEKTIEALRDKISIQVGRETGILTLAVTTDWPDLSQAIAQNLIDEISRFNMDTRQSQAATERAFIEERVDSSEHDLREAESELQEWLQANRQFEDSPDLMFQYERLQRTVSLRQTVFTTLVQSFEQARISEVRDTPVITVLQAPFLPPGPDDRRLLLFVALGIVLGGMAGVVMAFIVEALQRPAGSDPAREDFRESWDGLLRSFGLRRGAKA
jgi:uncharacterized protein involved in exopolysaccharide biosynthesis